MGSIPRARITGRAVRPVRKSIDCLTSPGLVDVELMPALNPGWAVSDGGKSITREFTFPAYSWTIAFADFIKAQGREVLIADASKLALRR